MSAVPQSDPAISLRKAQGVAAKKKSHGHVCGRTMLSPMEDAMPDPANAEMDRGSKAALHEALEWEAIARLHEQETRKAQQASNRAQDEIARLGEEVARLQARLLLRPDDDNDGDGDSEEADALTSTPSRRLHASVLSGMDARHTTSLCGFPSLAALEVNEDFGRCVRA